LIPTRQHCSIAPCHCSAQSLRSIAKNMNGLSPDLRGYVASITSDSVVERPDGPLALAEAKEPSFLKFLTGPWRSFKSSVEARYDFAAHAVKPTVTSALQKLVALHNAEAEIAASTQAMGVAFGTDAPALLLETRDGVAARRREDRGLKNCSTPAVPALPTLPLSRTCCPICWRSGTGWMGPLKMPGVSRWLTLPTRSAICAKGWRNCLISFRSSRLPIQLLPRPAFSCAMSPRAQLVWKRW